MPSPWRLTLFLTLHTLPLMAAEPLSEANQPSSLVQGSLAARLDDYLTKITGTGFNGSVLIAKDGEVILSKGYGVADRATKAPVSPETVFEIGSITKPFTAAAILRLEMDGRLRVADRLGDFFENVPDEKRTITLHHLLTHSAGLIDVLGEDDSPLSRDEMVRGALASKLRFGVGERWAYSNLGYSLLAAIVELRSGRTYEQYLREKFFEPAGVTQTGYRLVKWRSEMAHGYRGGKEWGLPPVAQRWADDGPSWNLRGNGGLLSTTGDLYRWYQALEGDKVLSAQAKQKYFASHVPEDAEKKSFYCYGWTRQTTSHGTQRIGHNGGNGIFRADLVWFPEDRVVLVIMSNVAELSGIATERRLLPIIFAERSKTADSAKPK